MELTTLLKHRLGKEYFPPLYKSPLSILFKYLDYMCNKYLLIKLKSKYHVPVEARLVCDNIPLTQLIWHKQIIIW